MKDLFERADKTKWQFFHHFVKGTNLYRYHTMHMQCIIILHNMLWPSICPSVTHWYCIETAEWIDILKEFEWHIQNPGYFTLEPCPKIWTSLIFLHFATTHWLLHMLST